MEKKVESLKSVIDSFTSEYYKNKIDNIETEILNISMDRPRKKGINERNPGKVVATKDKEKEINKLRKEKETYRKMSREAGIAITEMQRIADQLADLSKKDFLIDKLDYYLNFKQPDMMKETQVYEENKPKYRKIYLQTDKKIYDSKMKISKILYKAIKKNSKLQAYKVGGKHYQSIAGALKDNRLEVESKGSPAYKFAHDVSNKYFSNLGGLNVNEARIEFALNKVNGKLDSSSLTSQGVEAYFKLRDIEKLLNQTIAHHFSRTILLNLKEKYTQIVEISREAWYMGEILGAFRNTLINDTNMYIGLTQMVREQEAQTRQLLAQVNVEYEKSEIEKYVSVQNKLQKLYYNILEYEKEIETLQKSGKYERIEFLKSQILDIRYEMIKILKDYPELNKDEYEIDIKAVIEKEKEIYKAEIQKASKKTAVSPVSEMTQERVASEPVKVEEPAQSYIEKLEANSTLQIHRTTYYQEYMMEKIKKSDLGKISFSAFLEQKHPGAIELIEIEKERERVAKNVYLEYLKYYAGLTNKESAMSFQTFAEMRYELVNAEVPLEYEAEYNRMAR